MELAPVNLRTWMKCLTSQVCKLCNMNFPGAFHRACTSSTWTSLSMLPGSTYSTYTVHTVFIYLFFCHLLLSVFTPDFQKNCSPSSPGPVLLRMNPPLMEPQIQPTPLLHPQTQGLLLSSANKSRNLPLKTLNWL